MHRRDGFPGERRYVLPGPLVEEALQRDPTSHLLVTDAGYFPRAARHGLVRRAGAPQAIVIMCTDGAGWCELDGIRHDVSRGHFLVIPPQTPHRYYADLDQPWSIWWLHLAGSDVASLLRAMAVTVYEPTAALTDPLRAVALIASVCDDLAAGDTHACLTAAAGGAWHLLARLAAGRGTIDARHEPIARIQIHLRENLAQSVRVPDLAALAGFSPSHFSTRFRAATGCSVLEYVKRLRMERARELLISGDSPIADVAATVGYADPLYFSRQFREVHELSPRQFRTQSTDKANVTLGG